MTFTPKFVDMVRNVTTVQGTGAVTLRAAVSGYTSLAAAVIAGDQFYYCIQGVDKPAEREVGRGTMQANGTVARQAISGAQTNFTLGTKTIALVAAAEWFDKLDQLAASGTAAAAPAGWPLGLFTAAGGATVPTNVTTAETSGYAAAGQGSARYQYDAAVNAAFVTANPKTAFLAADGRGFRLNPGHRLTVEMFGGKADYAGNPATATDNYAPLMAALQFQPDPARPASPIIHLGIGSYYCSATLEPRRVFRLKGQGALINGGAAGYTATRIIFPTDTLCLLISASNTVGQTTGTAPSAGQSIIEGICFEQVTKGTNLSAHGIQARATVDIRDCAALIIAGDGFHIAATAGSGGATEGNANDWRMTNCYAQECGGNGLYVQGGDANAGICTGFVTHPVIGGCGVLDEAWYVNTYNGLQITGYGDGGVHYGGRHYQLIAADESLGGTTTPGTNPFVWYDLRAGTVQANFPTWVSATSYKLKLPFFATGNPAVVGTYQEAGSVFGHAPGATVIGGNLGLTRESSHLTAGGGSLYNPLGFGASLALSTGTLLDSNAYGVSISANFAPDLTTGVLQSFTYAANGGWNNRWLLKTSGQVDVTFDSTESPAWGWTLRNATATFGKASEIVEGCFYANQVALGDALGNYRLRRYGSAAPTTGQHAVGEMVWNIAPTSGGTLGWVCTAAGTPGTWTAVAISSGSGVSDGDKGDVSVASSGAAWTVESAAGELQVGGGVVRLRSGGVAGTQEAFLYGTGGVLITGSVSGLSVQNADLTVTFGTLGFYGLQLMGAGRAVYNNGLQVVGERGAAVADATDAASAITQLNALLARCRAHGLIA